MTVPSKTYYVSSLHGSADFDGLTPQTPFLHPAQASALSLQPGDKVLLERGSVFAGEAMHLKNCGDIAGAPIEIGAYGTGDALPCIAANGTGVWYQDYGTPLDFDGHVYRGEVSSAVLLYDVENIVLRDLEITNDAPFTDMESYCAADKMDRTGVAVVARDRGTLHSITLTGLFVHDVKGNVYNKHMNNGGIYMTALTPADEAKTGVARYDGVTVENCMVQQVSRWGIAVGYSYRHRDFAAKELAEEAFLKYGHENITLRGNYVVAAGGDAITPMYALRPLVEHNTADSCAVEMNDRYYKYPGKRQGKVAAAIWPWKCKDALLRYNDVADTKLNQDGMAYDADSGDGTVYEYNYSAYNEGGAMMFCLGEAVHSTYRHNVSYRDLGGVLSPSGNPDGLVEGNTFYMEPGVPLRRKRNHGKMKLVNNTVVPADSKED